MWDTYLPKDFPIEIQIVWKLNFTVIKTMAIRLLQLFSHTATDPNRSDYFIRMRTRATWNCHLIWNTTKHYFQEVFHKRIIDTLKTWWVNFNELISMITRSCHFWLFSPARSSSNFCGMPESSFFTWGEMHLCKFWTIKFINCFWHGP